MQSAPESNSAFSLIDDNHINYQKNQLKSFSISIDQKKLGEISTNIADKKFDTWDWYTLARLGDKLDLEQIKPEKLLVLDYLSEHWEKVGVIPYTHQQETARKVIDKLHGQAILADEVGLGKTIEAGLILKEYILRGLASKVLILTPASLLWQWYLELAEKFQIYAGIQKTQWDWEYSNILIASLDTAKRSPHAEIIKEIPYDLIIIDEAHKLKNEKTQSYKFVNSLQKKYCLMLTATPLQNNLKELYNLVALLKPGQLGSYRSFKEQFVLDKRSPKNPVQLRELLDQVMIRNKRENSKIKFTKRIVEPIIISLSPKEQKLYQAMTDFIKERSTDSHLNNILPLITLQRELCSSFLATALTLEKMIKNLPEDKQPQAASLLKELADLKQNSKCDALERLIPQLKGKIIIFTEYRASQDYIRYRLERLGYQTLAFDGSLSRGKKQWIRQQFQDGAQILVSTESGGEGLNFQFCNQIINFDLPWNPMKLEQRIGRVHRLGQKRDVYIYNLITKDTIEEQIMYLLHQKINMFETIIGELDVILLHLKLGHSFEREIMRIFLKNQELEDVKEEFDQFGEQFLKGQKEVQESHWDFI